MHVALVTYMHMRNMCMCMHMYCACVTCACACACACAYIQDVTPEEEEAISSIMQSGTVRVVSVPYTRDVAYQALLSTIYSIYFMNEMHQ